MFGKFLQLQTRRAITSLVLATLILSACSRPPPETRLRERIGQMQDALESRRPSDFAAGIAEDFIADAGLDKEGIRNYLRIQMLRNQRIGATLGPLDVELHGERATVTFSAVLTGGSGGFLPDTARPWKVTTGWRDGPDDWLLIHARWEPLL